MKPYFIFLFSLLCLNLSLKAQDQIYKRDNTKLQVKIVEVGPEEIKYKLSSNLTGPTYVESKTNVLLIVFENGQYEVVNAAPAAATATQVTIMDILNPPMSKADSLTYYRHANNISVNFLNFFNNEVGLIYQREFFKSQFNIIVPIAFGVAEPSVTQNVYFGKVYNTINGSGYSLSRKIFEAGFGINYYPSLRTNVNYFIGPAFRYMRYEASQYANFYDATQKMNVNVTQGSTLSRYCVSITNGVTIRTRSRLTTTLFGSLGFKNDVASNPIKNPGTNEEIKTIDSNFSLFFWAGLTVGFNF